MQANLRLRQRHFPHLRLQTAAVHFRSRARRLCGMVLHVNMGHRRVARLCVHAGRLRGHCRGQRHGRGADCRAGAGRVARVCQPSPVCRVGCGVSRGSHRVIPERVADRQEAWAHRACPDRSPGVSPCWAAAIYPRVPGPHHAGKAREQARRGGGGSRRSGR